MIVTDGLYFCWNIYWMLEEVRRQAQKDWFDYRRKKRKRMNHVVNKDKRKTKL